MLSMMVQMFEPILQQSRYMFCEKLFMLMNKQVLDNPFPDENKTVNELYDSTFI